MSNKHSQELSSSYVDGLKVKISEKYKPPPRISLPMSYAHRLTLNKQIQDNLPNYEFLLEKTVKEKMGEWKTARNIMFNELKCRVNKAKDELIIKQQQNKLEDKLDEIETKSILDNISSTSTGQSYSQLYTTNNTTASSILTPLQPATISYSNILKPIPLNNQNYSSNVKPVDKSPFNISDFEEDTSSPFDNMELKSINDLEELAQVLKKDEPNSILPNYNQPVPSNNQINYTNYSIIGSDYSYNIPNSSIPPHYIQPISSTYSRTNGYYFTPETLNQSFSNQSYLKQTDYNNYPKIVSSDDEKTSTTLQSIPHIIKALESELNNTHLDNTKPNLVNNSSTESENRIYPKAKTKSDEELDDTFNSLTKSMQDLSKSISLMGFPLSRVARVCKVIGDDHKKIVEHLLAMSDLLDLGFPEVSVSKALLQCDNDRDKALDVLIS